VLLGLTATPERTDGESILHWFGDRIAVELRLWDALERQLLSPFHYFGLHDSTNLAQVRWTRGAYDRAQLENVYIGDDARVAQILSELQRKVTDVHSMRALGFCVGIEHARYMARRFNDAGIPSLHVSADSTSAERDDALRKLKAREVNCLFAVDLFNEGVDVPEIDTVLFLRPTESATVFLQQLGRGLRRTHEKDCLTVLDFIGNANRNFRFDLRYRAITGATRAEVVKHGLLDCYAPSEASVPSNADGTMSGQVVLKVPLGVTQRNATMLEQRMHLEARLELQQTPHLRFGQRARAIRLDSERFERLPCQIRPAALEDC
jgi:hypothetical protein